ncbi:hypothetical protein HNY73_022836 [Argiope bruennichi]|uniref:Uncharacterized protein n=1 Tax=Argiope bruennichi TaxID=94029 RepID=A0A8T0E5U2_ARGBR|nr:hypothetical protein HNY73_022836 [Argiope bruennichi]
MPEIIIDSMQTCSNKEESGNFSLSMKQRNKLISSQSSNIAQKPEAEASPQTDIFEQFTEIQSNQPVNKNQKGPYYSHIARKIPKSTATILIYPKEKKPNTNVEDLLKKELQQSETTVKIKSVRRIQKGGLAITCKREEDLQKLTETLKEAFTENITTKRPRMRYPRIIIYNVSKNVPMEDVQRAIRAHTKNPEDLKRRFKMRGRTEDTSHLILEAPSEAFHRLKNLRTRTKLENLSL